MLRHGSLTKQVQWYEGMLLSPQHFQQSQIYNEQQLRCTMEVASPFFWGVQDLDCDVHADSGIVTVTRVSAVMPDGLVVDFDAAKGEGKNLKLDLNVTEKGAADGPQTWRVSLAVARRGLARFPRFLSVRGEKHPDENDGEFGLEVARLDPIFSLSADEGSDIYVRLGLIGVERTDDGSYHQTDYVPPLIRVSDEPHAAGQNLGRELIELAANMRQKARGLVERQKREGEGEHGSGGTQAEIQALVGALLPFEFLAESRCAHPFELYRALGAVLGSVSSLEHAGLPPKLRAYVHDDVWPGFRDALKRANGIVDRVQLKFRTTPIEASPTPDDPYRYVMDIPPSWSSDELWIEAEAGAGHGREGVEKWMAECRIVSDPADLPPDGDSKLERLRRARLHGVEAVPQKEIPRLGVRQDDQRALFKIMVDDNLVRRGERLFISCTDSKLQELAPKYMLFYKETGEGRSG